MRKKCTDDVLKKSAEIALKQINDKKYGTDMKMKGIKNICKYGIAFCGKKVEIVAEQYIE